MCVILLVLSRGQEVESVKPSLCCESLGVRSPFGSLGESLECAASAFLLYLKGGAYMALESPTGGPNDVVFNMNGLVLL